MKFTVTYYGLLAERRGLMEEEIESSCKSPATLYQELDASHSLGISTADFRAAVNDEFVSWDHALADGDSIALLPPMSGG